MLSLESVDHQNSLQVQYASRFVKAATDTFEIAKEMILRIPKFKEPPGSVVS